MVKYFYQNWLLDCPYLSVDLNDYVITFDNDVFVQDLRYDWNLFDCNQREFTRKVDISMLDRTIDTPRDWQHFLVSVEGIDKLILWEDRKNPGNSILTQYLNATRQAYVWHLRNADVTCFVHL